MENNSFILQMQGITKEFPGVKALDDVNLSVKTGTIHAICGENGAGKSTLMKVLSGVYPHGTYVLATNNHVVAVVDGNYYDTWDSGDETPIYVWRKEE